MVEKNVLDLFKVMVVDSRSKEYCTRNLASGIVTNFVPNGDQLLLIAETFKPLPLTTLFSVEEVESSTFHELICKQFLHYVEVYGLNAPGLFDLEVTKGKTSSVVYIRGVTQEELSGMVRKLLYANAPVKDAVGLKEIVNFYNISYNISLVANNELRVLLFDENKDRFDNGDDAVRYLCFKATSSALLIKSKEVINQIQTVSWNSAFFEKHATVLARVFNRHKPLILAAKNMTTRSIINKISRMSKEHHVPVYEPLSKKFISEAVKGNVTDGMLDKMSVRDKFKFLNVIQYKETQSKLDAFIIRNGKIHISTDRKIIDKVALDVVKYRVLCSLKKDLDHLRGKNILLDKNVDYGLPISRKQCLGNLPFGTTVSVKGQSISSGIYWEDAWGATDLDLSTINISGSRTGWGAGRGYYKDSPINFSGDLTSAPSGAMEFMTSKVSMKDAYGLFVNVFRGSTPCRMELVVGTKTKDRWIGKSIVREKTELNSRGNVIGFVKDGKFVVYQGRLNNQMVSGTKDRAVVNKGTVDFWTVSKLFDSLGIYYDVEAKEDKSYDFDLSYSGFSFDKLENLLTSEE